MGCESRYSVVSIVFSAPVFVICALASQFTSAQVPSLNEPFPGNHGPEPDHNPSSYSGCPEVCSRKLSDAMRIIADLEKKVNDLNITVITKLNTMSVSGSQSAGNPNGLQGRVTNVENYLYGNMTSASSKLRADVQGLQYNITQEITNVRNYVDDRLLTLPSGGGGGSSGGSVTPAFVYSNLTSRINTLEFTKVQTLIDENNVWRKNFEVVNKTFAKLKKSRYSNDVIVVG